MTLKIVLTWREGESSCLLAKSELAKQIGDTSFEVVAPKTNRLSELIDLGRDADVLLGQDIPREVINQSKMVKLVQLVHAGVSESGLDFESLKKRNIIVGNVSGSNAIAVAEMAMALMLALAKSLVTLHNASRQGRWISYDVENVLLRGKTLGVIGLGRIGSDIAVRAKAFGMRVIGIKKHITPSKSAKAVDFQGLPKDLDRILSESDFVILSIPATHETEGLIGERELKLMKPTSYLINVCRAAIIQERPLGKALREKWIAGYASDVWFTYPNVFGGWHAPVLSREEIHLMDNVIVSPDRSVASKEAQNQMIIAGAANVAAFVRGEKLPNQVNLDEQY